MEYQHELLDETIRKKYMNLLVLYILNVSGFKYFKGKKTSYKSTGYSALKSSFSTVLGKIGARKI